MARCRSEPAAVAILEACPPGVGAGGESMLDQEAGTHLGADDISMWVLPDDRLDDGGPLCIGAARVETLAGGPPDRSALGSPNGAVTGV